MDDLSLRAMKVSLLLLRYLFLGPLQWRIRVHQLIRQPSRRDDRSSRIRQNVAGAGAPLDSAADEPGRGTRGYPDLQCTRASASGDTVSA